MGFFWGMVGERVPSALLWEVDLYFGMITVSGARIPDLSGVARRSGLCLSCARDGLICSVLWFGRCDARKSPDRGEVIFGACPVFAAAMPWREVGTRAPRPLGAGSISYL